MATVNTVLGPIDSADLGFTLSHEHLGTNAAGIRQTYPEFFDREGVKEQAIAALTEAYNEGLRTIIDVSTIDLGRDVLLMDEVSRASGVQIVCATGNHLAVPRPFGDVSPDVIAGSLRARNRGGYRGHRHQGRHHQSGQRPGRHHPSAGSRPPRRRPHLPTRPATRISTHTWSPERIGEQQVRVLKGRGG